MSDQSSTVRTFDINDRAFEFAVRVVKLCQFLEKNTKVSKLIINQLLDSGTSIGSNLEEAKSIGCA